MLQLIDDATKVRVIRALIGMTSADFAAYLGVRVGAVTDWEHGRSSPRATHARHMLALCHERGIAILPCGMPVPYYAVLKLKESDNGHQQRIQLSRTEGRPATEV